MAISSYVRHETPIEMEVKKKIDSIGEKGSSDI